MLLVWTGSVLWHLARLKPSEDELNIRKFLKLQIYHQFYLFHNGGVQTSKSRCISNNEILLDNCFTPPASVRRALWSSTSVGTTQITLTSAHVLHTLNLPLFSSQSLQLSCESPALHIARYCLNVVNVFFKKKTTWECVVLSKITQSKCSGRVQRSLNQPWEKTTLCDLPFPKTDNTWGLTLPVSHEERSQPNSAPKCYGHR